MRLFHLSDLHIGKRVNEFSMIEDQKYILERILDLAEKEMPDGVILAGDIYDKQIPSAEAVQVFDEFITKLAERKFPVFVISGNHDSAERLAFGGRLLNSRGIYLSPVYDGTVMKIPIADQYGTVWIHLLPFIRPAAVRRVYEEVLVPAGMGDVAIYTEMGRFMMGPYGCLVTTAIHEKHTHKEYIGVDACAVNLMRPAMYGAYHHITVMGKENAPCDHKYDITGSLCENNDKFAIDRMLPKIDMGDVLVIHDTGAHGFSMGYNYNGKLKSAEVLLKEDGTTQLIRRAETPADYFATFDCFDIGKKLIEK